MWPDRRLLERLDIVHPIVQAPMGGASTPELVAAVSNAGGLGWLGAAMMAPDMLRAAIRDIRRLTRRPFGVNIFTYAIPLPETEKLARMRARMESYVRALGADPDAMPAQPPLPDIDKQIEALLEEAPPAFSFTFGMPAREVIAAFKERGVFVAGTATTVSEARALADAGVDGVVAQGYEAGGHRGTFAAPVEDSIVGTMALVPMVVDAVELPVIAAGGIMDGRGVAAALALGASAASLGTAFLPCPENGLVSRLHRDTLLARGEAPTVLSRAYTGRHARFIKNRFIAEMSAVEADIPAYPYQIELTGALRKESADREDADSAFMLAGQGYPMSRALPAGELVETLVREAAEVLAAMRSVNLGAGRRG